MTTQDPITLYRLRLYAAAERRIVSISRRRFVFPAGLAFAAIVVTSAALAANNWLTGNPAPRSVVSDFAGYAPQLGFNPAPGRAVLVAQDRGSYLYATTNSQGTYCIVASAPWKRPNNLPDGGTCIPQKTAAQTIVAGFVGASRTTPDTLEGRTTVLIAGRIDERGTTRVAFTTPTGETITRPVGTSGFFLASLPVHHLCGDGDWTPTFIALNAEGQQLARSTFMIERQLTHKGTGGVGSIACQFPGLTSATAPSSRLKP